MRICAQLVLLAAVAAAQDQTGNRIDKHVVSVLGGQFLDLDTGTALSRPRIGDLVADLHLIKTGQTFVIRPVNGAKLIESDAAAAGAPEKGWGDRPVTIQTNRRALVLYVRTDRRRYARVNPDAATAYAYPMISVRWEINMAGGREFPTRATITSVDWLDGLLAVRWTGAQPRYLVRATAGDSTAELVVEGRICALGGLAPGRLHRIEVIGITADGLRAAPATVAYNTGVHRLRRKSLRFPGRWYSQSGGLSLREMKAFSNDPDLLLFLYGAFAPGGVIKVGKGEAAFRNLQEFPRLGYRPLLSRIDEGDVYAVRTKDGRYGKVWMHNDGVGRDYRAGMTCEVVFLEGGGWRLPPRPADVAWSRAGEGGIDLKWPALKRVTRYRVRENGKAQVLWEGGQPGCTLRLKSRAVYQLEVSALHEDRIESEPELVKVHTYPERYRMGTFTLDCQAKTGFSFTDLQLNRAKAEIYISRSAGGASSLTIAGPYGIGKPPGDRFGKIPPPDWKTTAKSMRSDARKPQKSWFCLRTREGGVASVRITGRNYPNVAFEYLYAPPLWSLAAVRVKGRKVSWGKLDEADAYLVTVNGQPVARTKKTECELERLRRNRFHVIELTAFMDDGSMEGPLRVETHTFSNSYRLGSIALQPFGRQGAEFATGGIVSLPNKGDFVMRVLDATRVEISATKGLDLRPGDAYGSFPSIGAAPALQPSAVVTKAKLLAGALLLRTKQGGFASVRFRETQQWRLWTLEFVYQAPVGIDDARKAIRAAAKQPDAETTTATRRALAMLGDPDTNIRNRALTALTRQGLAAGALILDARAATKDPELRRLLDRWLVTIYERELR